MLDENELNTSFKEEATLEIDHQNSDVVGDEFVFTGLETNLFASPLKDIITDHGDDILRVLSSPESTSRNYDSGDSVVGSIASLSFDNSESDDLSVASSSRKRVPFTDETERKQRKKQQMKRASIRYREKKKAEMEAFVEENEQTLQLNKELKEEKKKKLAEFERNRSLVSEKSESGQ